MISVESRLYGIDELVQGLMCKICRLRRPKRLCVESLLNALSELSYLLKQL